MKLYAPRFRSKLFLMVLLLCTLWILWATEQTKSFLQPPMPSSNRSAFCTDLRPKFGPYQQAVIKEPGLHCVSVDFWQQRLADLAGHTGPTSDSNLITIIANDVTIEMSNHTIYSDRNSNGIVAQRIEQPLTVL
jgi:hypothetical protein